MKRTAAAIAASLALLAVPGSALANSTGKQYNGTVQSVQSKHASRKPATTSPTTNSTSPATVKSANATRTASTGSLPFTGLDVGALAGGAVVLLGAGLVLRRVSATDRK